MDRRTLAALNLLALVLFYLGFVPYNTDIAKILILLVSIVLLVGKR